MELPIGEHEFIFSDTTPLMPRKGIDYQHDIYVAQRFEELQGLEEKVEAFRRHEKWFARPEVHTVSRVAQEQARIAHLLTDKLKFLYRAAEARLRRKKDPRVARILRQPPSREEELMSELVFRANRLARRGQNSSYQPKNPESYRRFVDTLTGLSLEKGLKHNHDKKYERIRKADDLHADEELVGAAIYRALHEQRPSAIVSPDFDILNLIVAARETLWPTLLHAAPIDVYMLKNGRVVETWKSKHWRLPEEFIRHHAHIDVAYSN